MSGTSESCTYGPFPPLLGRVVVGLVLVAVGGFFVQLELGAEVYVYRLRPLLFVGSALVIGLYAVIHGLRHAARFDIRREGNRLVVTNRWRPSASQTFELDDPVDVIVDWREDNEIWRAFGKAPRSGRLVVVQRDDRKVELTERHYFGDDEHERGAEAVRRLLGLG